MSNLMAANAGVIRVCRSDTERRQSSTAVERASPVSGCSLPACSPSSADDQSTLEAPALLSLHASQCHATVCLLKTAVSSPASSPCRPLLLLELVLGSVAFIADWNSRLSPAALSPVSPLSLDYLLPGLVWLTCVSSPPFKSPPERLAAPASQVRRSGRVL